MVTALRRDLDHGEAASIALGIELQADLVLMDEREGRRAAQGLELKVVGVLGILLEAHTKGMIAAVRPCLDDLRQCAGFYISDSLYAHVLSLAGESAE